MAIVLAVGFVPLPAFGNQLAVQSAFHSGVIERVVSQIDLTLAASDESSTISNDSDVIYHSAAASVSDIGADINADNILSQTDQIESAGYDISNIEGDFSTQRIIVALKEGCDLQQCDRDYLVSSGANVYVLQYGSVIEAKRAYLRYDSYEGIVFVAPDSQIQAAEGDISEEDDAADGLKNFQNSIINDSGDLEADVPIADLSTLESDKKTLESNAGGHEGDESAMPAESQSAVIALIDTAIPAEMIDRWNAEHDANAQLVARVSAIGETQPSNVASTMHGAKMLAAVLEANPNARVVSIEALDATGYGSASTVYAALELAAAAQADIVNMSFVGYDVAGNDAIKAGVDEVLVANSKVALIAAAGNNNADVSRFIPACYDGVTGVGALDVQKVAYAQADNGVLRGALSDYKQQDSNYGKGLIWAVADSTSYAAATVSGVLSTMRNELDSSDWKSVLQEKLLRMVGLTGSWESDKGENAGGESDDADENGENEGNAESGVRAAADQTWSYSSSGVQTWTVPTTGIYSFTLKGAGGGSTIWTSGSTGGRGGLLTASLYLEAGETVCVGVGGKGEKVDYLANHSRVRVSELGKGWNGGGQIWFGYVRDGGPSSWSAGGGGGATYVAIGSSGASGTDATLASYEHNLSKVMLVAGGGGGSATSGGASPCYVGGDGGADTSFELGGSDGDSNVGTLGEVAVRMYKYGGSIDHADYFLAGQDPHQTGVSGGGGGGYYGGYSEANGTTAGTLAGGGGSGYVTDDVTRLHSITTQVVGGAENRDADGSAEVSFVQSAICYCNADGTRIGFDGRTVGSSSFTLRSAASFGEDVIPRKDGNKVFVGWATVRNAASPVYEVNDYDAPCNATATADTTIYVYPCYQYEREKSWTATGAAQAWQPKESGIWLVTLKGAGGGSALDSENRNQGGKGGYVQALLALSKYDTYYIGVGTTGRTKADRAVGVGYGGWNGGGNSQCKPDSSYNAAGGGGATHFASGLGSTSNVIGAELSTYSGDNLSKVLLVAGGGGGGGGFSSGYHYNGGAGGANVDTVAGEDGGNNASVTPETWEGGNLPYGGSSTHCDHPLAGGNAASTCIVAGGGGGGYWGGYGANYHTGGTAGGGGGSGFITSDTARYVSTVTASRDGSARDTDGTAAVAYSQDAIIYHALNGSVIAYDVTTGSGTHTATLRAGSSFTAAQVPSTSGGAVFIGWSTVRHGDSAKYVASHTQQVSATFSGSMDLFPIYRANNTISFDANGGLGTMSSVTIEAGISYTVPACTFTREHFHFTSWNTKADGTGTSYSVSTSFVPPGDITLYAQWEHDQIHMPEAGVGGVPWLFFIIVGIESVVVLLSCVAFLRNQRLWKASRKEDS